MASCNGPPNQLPLKFRCVKLDKNRISLGITPERLRRERSRLEILGVEEWHLIPDQEHQMGFWKLGFEKAGAGSQSRKVERGSKIVVAVPSTMSLVLQMPRGNLETINPRPLVMEVVTKDLNE